MKKLKVIIAFFLLLLISMHVASAQGFGGGGGGGIDGPPSISLAFPSNITSNVSFLMFASFSSASRGFTPDACGFCVSGTPCKNWSVENVSTYINDNFLSGNCSYYWNVSGSRDGVYNVGFQVSDSLSRKVNETGQILLDRFGPSVGYLLPSNNFTINSQNKSQAITFSFLVDDVSKIANCSLMLNETINQSDYSISGHTQLSFVVNFSINQSVNWSITCSDVHGFRNETEKRTFSIVHSIDTIPPYIKITNPINGSWLSVNYSWFNVTTSENSICEYYEFVCVAGVGAGGCGGLSPPSGVTIKNMTLTGGTNHAEFISGLNNTNSSFEFHEFHATCADQDGNINKTSIKFFVDAAPPVLSDNYAGRNNTWKSDIFSVVLYSQDNASGTANITYCVDVTDSCEPERLFTGSIVLTPQEEQIQKPITCARCKIITGSADRFCSRCGAALSIKIALESEDKVKEETNKTVELLIEIMKNPELLKRFEEFKSSKS